MNETSGTRADIHGGHNAIETNGAAASTAGILGNSVAFSSGTKLQANNHADLTASLTSFSFSFWFKVPVQSDIVGTTRVQKLVQYHFNIQSTYVQVYLGGAAQILWDGIPYTENAWTHFVVVCDRNAGVARLWKNGAIYNVPISVASLGSLDNTSPVLFGSGSTGAIYVDSVTYVNRALNAEEVAIIYNGGAGSEYTSPNQSFVALESEVENGSNFVIHLAGTNTAWTSGTPGSPSFTASGVSGITKIAQTVESVGVASITVNIPAGNTGTLTLTAGSITTTIPVVDAAVGTIPPTISVPANYYVNNRSNFPVTTVSVVGAGVTSCVVLKAVEACASFVLTGVNGCSRARTIQVAYRKGFSGAPTQALFGGITTITVQPWEYYTTDVISVPLAAGDRVCCREYSNVPNGSDTICGHQFEEPDAISGTEFLGWKIGTSADLLAVGIESSLTRAYAWGPMLLLAPVAANRLTVVQGDSLLYRLRTNDGHAFYGLPGLPVQGQGYNGDAHYVSATGTISQGGKLSLARLSVVRLATDVVDFYGHNDAGLDGTGTSVSIQDLHNKVEWMRAKVVGLNGTVRFWRMTLSPWTSANPDASGGGTPVEPFAEKFIASVGGSAAYNELVIASPASYQLHGVLDMHAQLRKGATGDDRKKWKLGACTDGTHFTINEASSLLVYAPLYDELTP